MMHVMSITPPSGTSGFLALNPKVEAVAEETESDSQRVGHDSHMTHAVLHD